MNCHRFQADEAEYFVYTDTIKFKVCIYCAVTAKEIGLTAEVLPKYCEPIIGKSLWHLN